MKALGEYSREGLALVATSGWIVLSYNAAFSSLTDSAGNASSQKLSDCLPTELFLKLREHFGVKKDAWSQECVLPSSSGKPIPARISVEFLKENDTENILVLRITDITEVKKKELLMKSVGEMLDVNKKRVEEAKRNFKAMLDLLPQGFLNFDCNGVVHRDYSSQVESIFKGPVAERHIADLLGFSSAESELLPLIFSGLNPQVCLDALPHELKRGDQTLEIAYTPIIQNERIVAVMTAVADVTKERALRDALEKNASLAKTLYAILSAKTEFIETLELVESLEKFLDDQMGFRRSVHTLKGQFSFLECHELAQLCHKWESTWRSKAYSHQSGREFISAIRTEMDAFLTRHCEILKIRRGQTGHEIIVESARLVDLYQRIKLAPFLDARKKDLLELIETLLSPKLEETLGWLQMAWVDALSKTSKPPSEISWDASLRVFPKPYQELFKTFVHVVRNAASHGIESPDARASAGKSTAGTLKVSACLHEATYRISFADDGRGIDPRAISELAQKNGIVIDPNASDEEIIQLVFNPDFSSKEDADDIAGRGLGLYIVRHEATLLKGTAEVRSQLGKGTTITITFPKLPIAAIS